jgi:hypothetical protein
VVIGRKPSIGQLCAIEIAPTGINSKSMVLFIVPIPLLLVPKFQLGNALPGSSSFHGCSSLNVEPGKHSMLNICMNRLIYRIDPRLEFRQGGTGMKRSGDTTDAGRTTMRSHAERGNAGKTENQTKQLYKYLHH